MKFLCPLTISQENLKRGIDIVEQAIAEVCASEGAIPEVVDFFEDEYSVSDDDRFRKAS